MSITRPNVSSGVSAVFSVALLAILTCAVFTGGVSAQKKSKKAPPKLKPAATGKAKASAPAKTTEAEPQKAVKETATAKPAEAVSAQKHPAFSSNPKVKEAKEIKASKASAKTTAKKAEKAKTEKEARVWNPNAKKEAATAKASDKPTAKPADAKSATSPINEKATAKETPVAVELKLKEKTAAAKKEVAAKKQPAAKKEVAKKETPKKETAKSSDKTGVAKKVEEKSKVTEKVYDAEKAAKAKAARDEKVAKAKAEKAAVKTLVKNETTAKEVVSKPAKNWTPAVTASRVKSDLNGKTITDVQSEELGDGMANWQFTAAQAKDVEILNSETSGANNGELTVETRLSVKKAKANFDGSYDRMRGTAKLHYTRVSKGWQLKRIENVSLAHGDTNMDDPALRNALIDRAPVVAFNPPPVNSGTVNTVTRRYEQPAPPVNNTTAVTKTPVHTPKKSDPYPIPRSDARSEVGGYSTEVVMAKTFSVARRQYEAVPFTVRQGGLVRGDFRVTSTDGDISTYIMSATEYQKWSATRAASVSYSAAGTIGGGLNLPLNPGEYYVVFYNYSPTGTTQTVEAAVRVEYLPRN